ncbi:MAG: precorrin-2 C(20)-methyltransferase [Fusicatenibacter sp.]|nr:precorrin-2 C(20)-methyltransferase [Lachnospiraceae bacterium]MDY2938257.1 precorrin-2 C(20)-methyltransferase [Fusicatenibacter sp.]
MAGCLFGVGVGPGDPELLTLKAVRLIRENEIIAVPGENPVDSIAYKIALLAVPELAEKSLLAVPMPMTKDPILLKESHDRAAEIVEDVLKTGKNVVFLTLGDPTVYSTYLYVHKRVLNHGYGAEIVSGISSFCAAAATLSIGLVEKAEELHVIPASYQIEEALKLPGTKVLMKAGKKMKQVRELLMQQECDVFMVENCGMENQKIYIGANQIPEDAGYYSLIIVKEKED